MPAFIFNDESVVNSYGFMIRNSGGRFDRFRENPVMLDSHDSESVLSVIGRWLNLRIEGSQLIADPEFDVEDPDALKISGKVDRGFVKGTSMGIQIFDAELVDIPGKGFIPVATDWELLEGSPVGVPSNKAALRFYVGDGKILKAEEVKLSIDNFINKKQIPIMEKITLSAESAKALGLTREPEVSEFNAAVMELTAKNATLLSAKEKAEKELSDHRTAQAKDLVDLAVKEGRITADKSESFQKLAVSDYKQCKDLLDAMPAKQTLSDKIVTGKKGDASREDWNYMKWLKEDPKGLTAMERDDPEAFKTLKAAYSKA